MENIVKGFSGKMANRGVNLEVRKGEVHALLGENGAGKTVLMSILYGLFKPDSGRIRYGGKALHLRSPKDALKKGIGMVHQHFMLLPELSVAENFILGRDPFWRIFKKSKELEKRVRKESVRLGFPLHPAALISELSVGEQQQVEIVKTLSRGLELLILDEPTAVLTPGETDQLLNFIRKLADGGMTVIFITHKLDEVMRVSDRVTVLREGRTIAARPTAETNPGTLARWMVGRELQGKKAAKRRKPGKTVLSVRALSVYDERGLPALKKVSFRVRENEIVGLAGVSGNGQRELALVLSGLLPASGGEYEFVGESALSLPPRALRDRGFHYVPADRHKRALIDSFSVTENLFLHERERVPLTRSGLLQFRDMKRHAEGLVEKYDIRLSGVGEEIAHLSGGNQQKVVVARELNGCPRFLLVNQPTRGIDLGAAELVREGILRQRNEGTAILLISAELEELFALSDRILVIFEGRILGEIPAERSRLEEVGLLMAGGKRKEREDGN